MEFKRDIDQAVAVVITELRQLSRSVLVPSRVL
jgi:hypothetical protein